MRPQLSTLDSAFNTRGRESPYDFSARAGRVVAGLSRDDHQRLATVLQCIRRMPDP